MTDIMIQINKLYKFIIAVGFCIEILLLLKTSPRYIIVAKTCENFDVPCG